MPSYKINYDVILDEMARQRPVVAKVEGIAREHFNLAKERLLDDFIKDPITEEINDGPLAENKSGTLDNKGNLFSYLGFPKGDNPIQPLYNLLSKIYFIRLTKVAKSGKVQRRFTFQTELPSNEEITNVTSLPWATGRSWALGIEKGISGFGQFLQKGLIRSPTLAKKLDKYFEKSSRSSQGLQIKIFGSQGRPGGFKPVQYLTKLFNNFRKDLRA